MHREQPLLDPHHWEQRYRDGAIPWDSSRPDVHLQRILQEHQIPPCRGLDVGCGTGTNTVYLQGLGFQMTGLDISPTAIGRAKERAIEQNADCQFLNADLLTQVLPLEPFSFVFDRGCFHIFEDPDLRARFAARVAALLRPGSLWCSLAGSTDGPEREEGPPRRSATQLCGAIEPHFEILELRATIFSAETHPDASAWVLVARRRDLLYEA